MTSEILLVEGLALEEPLRQEYLPMIPLETIFQSSLSRAFDWGRKVDRVSHLGGITISRIEA